MIEELSRAGAARAAEVFARYDSELVPVSN
jgi:hypothetical protein